MKILKEMFTYPLKSAKGTSMVNAELDDFGLVMDRRFMLVDQDGHFVTQRQEASLSLLDIDVVENGIRLTIRDNDFLLIDFGVFVGSTEVTVWRDRVMALVADAPVNQWLSNWLKRQIRLVFIPEESFRQVDRVYYDAIQRVGFADGFPFLIVSQASLDDLNSRLVHSVDMSRFRPNLVIDGCLPYEEDTWKRIQIGDIEFSVVKPCSRCVVTTIDQKLGKRDGVEPLLTLAAYRKNDFGVCFGQNAVHHGKGTLALGDRVEVLE